MRDAHHEELERLLGESPPDAARRARAAFHRSCGGPPGEIVLFGAGQLGRKCLAGLRDLGIAPLAFSDNSKALWNRSVDGLEVLPPPEAARRYATRAAFVVTIWPAGSTHRQARTTHQLRSLGCVCVTSFATLFWRHPQIFLPHYALDSPEKVLEQAADVRQALTVWEDEASRREYVAQIRWRLLLDFDRLPPPVPGEPYFRDELFAPQEDEVFVDCGAFDGDTLRSFLARRGERFSRVVALEPAPGNFARLRAWRDALPERVRQRIDLYPLAAASQKARLSFSAAEGLDAAVCRDGVSQVEAASLDEILQGLCPTLIKMDIEGAELDALEGASGLLGACRPVSAISVYHQQDHLWRVPLLLRRSCQDCALFLLAHGEEVWDMVCYSIPRERLRIHG